MDLGRGIDIMRTMWEVWYKVGSNCADSYRADKPWGFTIDEAMYYMQHDDSAVYITKRNPTFWDYLFNRKIMFTKDEIISLDAVPPRRSLFYFVVAWFFCGVTGCVTGIGAYMYLPPLVLAIIGFGILHWASKKDTHYVVTYKKGKGISQFLA